MRRKKKQQAAERQEATPMETKTDKFRRQASGGVKSDHDTFTLAELKRARGWKAEPGWERA